MNHLYEAVAAFPGGTRHSCAQFGHKPNKRSVKKKKESTSVICHLCVAGKRDATKSLVR